MNIELDEVVVQNVSDDALLESLTAVSRSAVSN